MAIAVAIAAMVLACSDILPCQLVLWMPSGSISAPAVGEVLEVVATEWIPERHSWRIHFLWRRWGPPPLPALVFCTEVVAYRLVVEPGGTVVPPAGLPQPESDTSSEGEESAEEEEAESGVTELAASSSSSSTP